VSDFTRRFISAVFLASIITLTFCCTEEAILTKIFLALFASIAIYEMWYYRLWVHYTHVVDIGTILVFGCIFMFWLPQSILGLVILTAFAYDTFAYLGGKTYGEYITKKRPFSKTSPNKTWEGLLIGLVVSAMVGVAFLFLWPENLSGNKTAIIIAVFGGFLAAFGDYLGSHYKRSIKLPNGSGTPFTSLLLPGHGGFIDRFLSLFTTALGAEILNYFLR